MKKIFACAVLLSGCSVFSPYSHEVVVPIHRVSATGVGEQIGEITFDDGDDISVTDKHYDQKALIIRPNISGLAEGPHGFHIHENPSCDPKEKDGKMVAAGAAGGHFDPRHTGKHLGPLGGGHEGDLPKLVVDGDGIANETIIVAGVTTQDISGRSVMIHEGGDNYSDTPAPLGGGGARIACGVIP